MKQLALLIIFALFTLNGFCQEYHYVDSLQIELQKFEGRKKPAGNAATPLTDTTKADIWYELARIYWCSTSDSGMDYAQQCLRLSEEIGYKKGIGNGNNGIGLILMCRHSPEQAVAYFLKALKIRTEINDLQGMAWTYNNLGLAYGDIGNYPLSIINHTNALKIREELGDKEMVEASLTKRGSAYEKLGDYPNAINDYLYALKTAEVNGSKMRIAEDYKVIAEIYDKMGNYSVAVENYLNSSKVAAEIGNTQYVAVAYLNLGEMCYKQRDYACALKNYLYSLKIREENKLSDYEIEDLYNKVALVYFMQGNYLPALKNCLHALQFYRKINARHEIAYCYNLLGNIYAKQGNLNEALAYETKSLSVAEKANARDVKESAYESLAGLNASLKRYKAAYDNEVMFKAEYDTIYNKENERKVMGLQMQYEFNKVQDSLRTEQVKKDAVSRQQIQRQKAFTGIGIAAFILLASLLFFVYRNYISQRKATAAMALARMRAEQSEKFKEKFLANMSHEIRTPMNAVLGMANLVLDTPLTDKQKNYVSAIKKSSENLLVILNDILELSKLEAGKMLLEKVPFRLRDQVTHVMNIMRFKADEKGLLFTSEVADDVPVVLVGDAMRLNEVLLNLLGNAIKFTNTGFVKLEVSTLNYGPGSSGVCKVEFRIKDTGIGMSPEQQQRIFESFVQGDNDISRKYGGTGLGLAISKTLIELQGGTIGVKSEEGKSSEFSFNIPYGTGDEKEMAVPEMKKELDYSPLSKWNILVVEDNEFNQVVIKDTLENLAPGIGISIAANGKIAVDMVQQFNYDLILMDVHMPEMDGYEATRFMRNNLKLNIPIVALTASVIRGDLDKCTEAGMNGYIPKPFKRNELLDELLKHNPL